jgi:tetratricopeptide (TPR) repeat protein
MTEKHGLLLAERVAFTGGLASMTRSEGIKLVRAHGGQFTVLVNRRTTMLVVGQDGWPLQADGRLTNKLRKARVLQQAGCKIRITSENDWLAHLDAQSSGQAIHRLYTLTQLSALLKVPGNQLRRWMAAGLIEATDSTDGVSRFDYSQAVSARGLCRLFRAGVRPARLVRSIRQLASWLPDLERPLHQLAVLERDGKLLVRLDDGLAEPGGQRCFDFSAAAEEPRVTPLERPVTAEEWFERACRHEDAGQNEEAVHAYRQALVEGGPSASVSFNLANVLNNLGQRDQAIERYYQCVEIEGDFAEAWNNLGVVLSKLNRLEEARAAFERAIASHPGYADAHYNLADLLDGLGQTEAAERHWRAYLRQDQQTAWAGYARQRLMRAKG